jgi:hypothetical protein
MTMRGAFSCVLSLFALCLYGGCDNNRALQVSEELPVEIHSYPAPEGSSLIVEDHFSNFRRATATAEFKSKLEWTVVRAFYRRELEARGWLYLGETVNREWGVDRGDRSAKFCRRGIEAELERGSSANHDWDYSLTLIWTGDEVRCHTVSR